MTQSQLAFQATAGEYLRYYKPPINIHTIVNAFVPSTVAFKPTSSADIVRVVQFPDVSFYQKDIDYEVMKTKTRAIIIRAGQNLWIDNQFERNYIEAKRVGLLVGAYWFYDDRIDPGRQADLLISLLRNKVFEMEVFIDWENSYGGAFGSLANVVAMMQRVEQAGLRIKGVGLYTGYYFFRAKSNPINNASQYNYLKDRALWLAWYTTNPANVLIPAPWTKLVHWQWGTPSVDWGQKTIEIDMNYFNGTQQEFDVRYGVITPPPPPPGGNMAYYELRPHIAGEYRSIRANTSFPNTPHILGSAIGRIDAGKSGKAVDTDFYIYQNDVYASGVLRAKVGDIWWKVYEANGISISGWVAEKHLGVTYLNKTFVGTPSTPAVKVHQIDIYSDGKISVDNGNPF